MIGRYPHFPDALAGSRALVMDLPAIPADRDYNAHRALRTCGIATLEVKIIAHDRCISTKSGRLIERLGNMICRYDRAPEVGAFNHALRHEKYELAGPRICRDAAAGTKPARAKSDESR